MALAFVLGRGGASVVRARPPRRLLRTVHKSQLSTWPRLVPHQALVAHSKLCVDIRARLARDAWTRRNAELLRVFPRVLATSSSNESLVQTLRRLIRVALHFAKLLGLALPLALTAPVAFSAGTLMPTVVEQWWELALWLAQYSSPTVMKFLQWASTRRDMFPASFCDRFETFHEHAPMHSWAQTEDALKMAFGDNWRDVMEVDNHPIGSGCIAQVYRGRIKETNEQVAVKVIHPHVKQMVALDLQLLRTFVAMFEVIPTLRWLGGKDSVTEFASLMERQLNLRTEGENLALFSEHFRNRKGLRFPVPLMDYTTENVLVESFEDGLHFSEILSQMEPPRRKAVARVVLEAYLRMVFLDNFAHGDLHPGNLLFDEQDAGRNARVSRSEAIRNAGVVVIDAGIVTKLEQQDLRNFVELFHAVATGNGYKAGELIVARSKGRIGPNGAVIPTKCKDLESFCTGMERIVNDALSWRLSLKQVHVGALLRQVMELCCTHEVKLEGKYASIVVSIAVLEAVGRKLDPDIDILAVALPIITQSLVKNICTERIKTMAQSTPLDAALQLFTSVQETEFATQSKTKAVVALSVPQELDRKQKRELQKLLVPLVFLFRAVTASYVALHACNNSKRDSKQLFDTLQTLVQSSKEVETPSLTVFKDGVEVATVTTDGELKDRVNKLVQHIGWSPDCPDETQLHNYLSPINAEELLGDVAAFTATTGQRDYVANAANVSSIIWHARIRFQSGVCGASWRTKSVQRITDVHEFPGHIACDDASESELVVPVFDKQGEVIALIDLDCPKKNGFSAEDERTFVEVARVMSEAWTGATLVCRTCSREALIM
ncbi:GAF domain-like [Phytophthora cactorum]|nr:GAF domain-like [Phytophthora cactorum]